MKKFKDIGYTPMRRDADDRYYGHFIIKFVTLGDDYRAGDEVAYIEWQTDSDYPTEHRKVPHWYGPSINVGSYNRSHTNQYEHMLKGMEVFKFVIKHFGYGVSEELVSPDPTAEQIEEIKYELGQAKEYSWEGIHTRMQPEVLVYVGLPALGIPRVIYDKRFDMVVEADNVAFPELYKWRAVSYDFDSWIGSALAWDYASAQNAVEQEVRAELAKINASKDLHGYASHGPFKYTWGSNKEAYKKAATKWLDGGRPVTSTGDVAPTVTPLADLLDCYQRFTGTQT